MARKPLKSEKPLKPKEQQQRSGTPLLWKKIGPESETTSRQPQVSHEKDST